MTQKKTSEFVCPHAPFGNIESQAQSPLIHKLRGGITSTFFTYLASNFLAMEITPNIASESNQ